VLVIEIAVKLNEVLIIAASGSGPNCKNPHPADGNVNPVVEKVKAIVLQPPFQSTAGDGCKNVVFVAPAVGLVNAKF
jgi:hypothetical protein